MMLLFNNTCRIETFITNYWIGETRVIPALSRTVLGSYVLEFYTVVSFPGQLPFVSTERLSVDIPTALSLAIILNFLIPSF